jgi:gliding motility-associated-like protein
VQNAATATGLGAGTYTVTVTEGTGCIGFAEVTVSEPTAVLPELTSVPGSCGLPNGTITATASGGVGPYSFVWDTDPVQNDATATGLLAGTYTVVVTDATGCTGTATGDVINVPGPVAGFIGEDVCLGSVSTFQNTSVSGAEWEWDMGDGTLFSQQNVQHTYTDVGDYTVTLTVTDVSGCSDTFSSNVVVSPVPVAAFAGEPLQGCAPLVTTFVNTGTSAGPTCLWEFGDGSSSTDCVAPVHTYAVAGCYDVTLTVTEAGCSSTTTVPEMVCVDPAPIAGFSINPNPVLTTSPLVVYLDGSVGATGHEWTFSGGTPGTSTEPSLAVDYAGLEPGFYDVCQIVTNDAGCADTLCRVLILRDELRVHVPNSFTPDGDGVNDLFIPVLVGHGSDQYRLSIFDRWGLLVFETEDPMMGWDGSMSGTVVQDGVYIWKLRVNANIGAEVQEYTGHVTLLR